MIRMYLFARSRAFFFAGALASALLMVGCSRQIDVPTEEGAAPSDQAPFRAVASNTGENTSSTSEPAPTREKNLPFDESHDLPAGTLLTVRLDAPIPADKPDFFKGSLDEAVVLHGRTIIPRGALASGRIEFASSLNLKPDRAYVRLALTSVQLSGTDVPVRTASLFARQHNPDGASNPGIRLEKGHRLTFRLTQPIYAANQTAQVPAE